MTHPINNLLRSINTTQRFQIETIMDEVRKVKEVKEWINSQAETPPIEDVKKYIDDKWPDLQSDLRDNIFIVALGETF